MNMHPLGSLGLSLGNDELGNVSVLVPALYRQVSLQISHTVMPLRFCSVLLVHTQEGVRPEPSPSTEVGPV